MTPLQTTLPGDYPTEVTSSEGDTVLIVQAFAFTKYLGRIKVQFCPQNTTNLREAFK